LALPTYRLIKKFSYRKKVVAMRLLVVSDTHENIIAVDKLHEVVNVEKPDAMIHCGDYISPITIRRLLRLGVDIYGVWGNNDGDKDTILQLIRNSRISIESQPREIMVLGLKALIVHGWRSIELTFRMIRSLAISAGYRYIFYGHTHRVELSIVRGGEYQILQRGFEKEITYTLRADEFDTLILNPGEASGILTGNPTYAIMDITNSLVSIRIRKLEVDR